MVIEIPGCDFRIFGGNTDWQIQYEVKRKARENTWEGRYFFPSLDFAVCKAYELMLRGRCSTVGYADVPDECRKAKEGLLKAVRKAVGR